MKAVGFIGLGRMGMGMVKRILKNNIPVVVYNRTLKRVKLAEKYNAIGAYSYEEFFEKLRKKNKTAIIWIMVTAEAVDSVLNSIKKYLVKGDIVIDGGNSFWKKSLERAKKFKAKGIYFLDVGVSGGILGEKEGYSLMAGGNYNAYQKCKKIFSALSDGKSFSYVGNSGAGHFVKLIHNAIEYGFLSSIAEGFDLIYKHRQRFSLKIKNIAYIYANKTIIEGKLTQLVSEIFNKKKFFKIWKNTDGVVPIGKTERFIKKLYNENKEIKVIKSALNYRKSTRKKRTFGGKIIALLRHLFGGHELKFIKSKSGKYQK